MSSGASLVSPQRTAILFSGSHGSRYVALQPGMRLSSADLQQLRSYGGSTDTAPREEPTSGGITEQSILRHLKTRDPDLRKNGGDICVVCQDDLNNQENEKIAILECGHEYHQKCVARWLVHKKFCPVCRSGVKLQM